MRPRKEEKRRRAGQQGAAFPSWRLLALVVTPTLVSCELESRELAEQEEPRGDSGGPGVGGSAATEPSEGAVSALSPMGVAGAPIVEACGHDGGACAAQTPEPNAGLEPTCPGCLIDGECVGLGAVDEGNECLICDPARAQTDWSPNDGVSCDDGSFCTTGDVCSRGSCVGEPRECDDAVACNGVSTCDDAASECSAPTNECADGFVCDVVTDTCVTTCSGCLVAGVCVASGSEASGNPCMVCDPAVSTTGLVPAPGKACGAGSISCSNQDTCDAQGLCQPNHLPQGTPCGNPSSSFCDRPDSCDGEGRCLQRLAQNGSSCDDGAFCTVAVCQGGACVSTGIRDCGANSTCNEAMGACVSTLSGLGEACASAADCAAGRPCTFWFVDSDGDGFGSGAPIGVCGLDPPNRPLSPGQAYRTNGGDCCDAGANANLVFPGQERFFGVPSACGSFDYDCDGEETVMPPLGCSQPASVRCEDRVSLLFAPVSPGINCSSGTGSNAYFRCATVDGTCQAVGPNEQLPPFCR